MFTDTVADRGKAARDCAGWHVCLEALEARLGGTAAPAGHWWREPYEGYRQDFGP